MILDLLTLPVHLAFDIIPRPIVNLAALIGIGTIVVKWRSAGKEHA